MTEIREPKELDFDIVHENWTRYEVGDDGVVLRVRSSIVKVREEGIGELGFPNIRIAANNILSALVPDSLKGTPSSDQSITPEDIKQGQEVTFKRKGEETWQEYKLHNGWTLLLRPEVTKIIKTKKYNSDREPLYWANIQPIFTVKRS